MKFSLEFSYGPLIKYEVLFSLTRDRIWSGRGMIDDGFIGYYYYPFAINFSVDCIVIRSSARSFKAIWNYVLFYVLFMSVCLFTRSFIRIV